MSFLLLIRLETGEMTRKSFYLFLPHVYRPARCVSNMKKHFQVFTLVTGVLIYTHLCELVHQCLWCVSKQDVEVQNPSNSPIGYGRSRLDCHLCTQTDMNNWNFSHLPTSFQTLKHIQMHYTCCALSSQIMLLTIMTWVHGKTITMTQ